MFLLQVDLLATVKTCYQELGKLKELEEKNIFPQFHFLFSVVFFMKPLIQVLFDNILSFPAVCVELPYHNKLE